MIRHARNSILVLTTIALVAATAWVARAQDVAAPTRGRFVVHLSRSTNDLHAAFMAVKMAHLAQEKGAATTLFLDLEGARLADTRQPLELSWGGLPQVLAHHFESFKKQGGKVLVCPHCAKAAGLDAKSLREGCTIGNPDTIAEMLLGADKILDY